MAHGFRVALALLGALLFFVGSGMACESWSASRGFDPERLCAGAVTEDCVTRETGTVAGGGPLDDVAVVYDDGREKVGVLLHADDPPEHGTRVTIDWWEIGGQPQVIALHDTATGRRYRTLEWPERFKAGAFWTGVVGALLIAVAVLSSVRFPRQPAAENDEAPPGLD